MMNCSGPCEQGRKLCPCPMACQMADDDAVIKWIVRITLIYSAIVLGGLITGAAVLSCTG